MSSTNTDPTLLILWEATAALTADTPRGDDPRIYLADWYEERGDEVMAAGLRWCVREGKRPTLRGKTTREWRWYNMEIYRAGDPCDEIPEAIIKQMANYRIGDGCAGFVLIQEAYSALAIALTKNTPAETTP